MNQTLNDRTPPHNIEAEQSVIGAVFLEPEAFSTASELLLPDDFYRASHQRIFQAMMDLSERGEPIDVVTVTTYLNDRFDARYWMLGASALGQPRLLRVFQLQRISNTIVKSLRKSRS